ncbi:MAG: GNAT family N-acetyltransferase, partial [Bdellovibrionales bacterium]
VFYCEHNGEKREDLLAARSRAFKRKYRNVLRKFDANDGITIGADAGPTYDPKLIDFLVQRKKQWTIERGKRGVFDEKETLAFYQAMARLAADRGCLLLNWMRDQGQPFAVTLNFSHKKVVYGHTLAIDLDHAKYMPGIFLNMEALIWASENGFEETNYMEGEEEYKARFAKHARLIHEYALARSLKGKAFLLAYRALRFYRAIKAHFDPRVRMASTGDT